MKNALLIFAIAAFTLSGIDAAPQPRNFGLKVKADGNSRHDKDTVTQTRTLLLNLSLVGTEPAPDVVVKWTIYGHSRSNHDPITIKSGELKTALVGGKAVELTTPEITITGVLEHSESSGSGRRAKSKKVPASGDEYYGYSVVVMNGSTMVAEAYSHPSLKSK